MNLISPDLLNWAHRLADASEPVVTKYFRKRHNGLAYKSDASPVTLADREVEAQLRQMIQLEYPDHGIIGEEHGNHNTDADYQWILDPIDGTRAFSCGRLDFGTLIGLQYCGDMVLGMLNQPITKERFVGCNGATLNSTTICSNKNVTLKTARFATTSPKLFDDAQRSILERVIQQCGLSQYGGDCYNYGLLAAGHIDLIMEAGLNIYDIAPLLPILHGSGAVVSDWQGNDITLKQSDIAVLVSANKALHEEALRLINSA